MLTVSDCLEQKGYFLPTCNIALKLHLPKGTLENRIKTKQKYSQSFKNLLKLHGKVKANWDQGTKQMKTNKTQILDFNINF